MFFVIFLFVGCDMEIKAEGITVIDELISGETKEVLPN